MRWIPNSKGWAGECSGEQCHASRIGNWPLPAPERGSRSSTSFLSSEKNDFVSLRNYYFFGQKSYLLIYLNFTITCLCLCVCLYCLLYAFKAFRRPSHLSALERYKCSLSSFFFFWNPLFIVTSLGWFFLVKVFPLMNNYFLILAFFFSLFPFAKSLCGRSPA